ncbi:hypothetical protein ACOBV9_19150 (plasmid) [Pseudoalteromonas espejiana]
MKPTTRTTLEPNPDGLPTWAVTIITITCGAISGFHSTQAPIIARCLTNENTCAQYIMAP